jgi:16S rRNA G527 N7-methylase RsmG
VRPSNFVRSVLARGLTPPPEAALERLEALLTLRARWGRVHNLSGPAALRDPWTTDVVDALAVSAILAPSVPLVDVGAGSGVPGALVAVLQPERVVVLVEPLAKRTAFLKAACSELGFAHLHVIRARWPLGPADVAQLPQVYQVVSRAVVDPIAWPALAMSQHPGPEHVLRMLAQQRPDFDAGAPLGFSLATALDYDAPGQPRRVERWNRLIAG